MSAEQEVRLKEIRARVDEFPADGDGPENLFRTDDVRFLLDEIASLKEQVETLLSASEMYERQRKDMQTLLDAERRRAESLSTELERVKKEKSELQSRLMEVGRR